jgi:hypothetical protein
MIGGSRESSPFDSSILSSRSLLQTKFQSSPFNENLYDRPESPSLSRRRTSIENLKKASRVKNSSMFAREQATEYDPSSPISLERPLASGRALTSSMQINPAPRASDATKSSIPVRGHRRGESQNKIPLMNSRSHERVQSEDRNAKSPSPVPSRNQPSPTKSALSMKHSTLPRSFDASAMYASDEDDDKVVPARPLRRQAKSVQFDTAPPQVNMYEAATPDPSSVASGSREGSYENYEDTDEDMYDMDRDMNGEEDSFDASLEDTQKTPVVLPEDWRGMTPDVVDSELVANFEDPFRTTREQGTPSEEWHKYRTASVDSENDSRPLPPVPKITEPGRRNSGNILDRVHNSNRALPSLPSAALISKADILGMKDHAMSLEDRLRLMGINDAAVERTSPDQASREKSRLQRHGLDIQVHEDEDVEQPTSLPAFSFPVISREAILRKVQSRTELKIETTLDYDVDTLDPDVPIRSTETSHLDIEIKQESGDLYDLYSIPAMQTGDFQFDMDDISREGSVIHHVLRDESESVYSGEEGTQSSSNDDDGPPTPRQEDIANTSHFDANENVDDSLACPDFSTIDDSALHASLHSYLASGDDDIQKREVTPPFTSAVVERNVKTPEPQQVEDEDEDPGSPQSVVHHPMRSPSPLEPEESEPVESLDEVPEPVATIKAPGSKLKARPSLTPADAATMAATRRQVSGSFAPPVPEKSSKRLSIGHAPEVSDVSEKNVIDRAVAEHKKRRESFMPSLDLPSDNLGEDMTLDMDREFDRVIESSKVLLEPFHYSRSQSALNMNRIAVGVSAFLP